MKKEYIYKFSKDSCKFCGQWVDLASEGNTNSDGSVSHEGCADTDTFEKENAGDAQ